MTIDEALKKLKHAEQMAGSYPPSAIRDIAEVVRELVLANTPEQLRPKSDPAPGSVQ